MSTPNQPVRQHIIAKVYLKQFKLEESSHIYCRDLRKGFNPNVQKVGLGSSLFCIDDYYTDSRLNDPYAIERLFSLHFENNWPTVINQIVKKEQLSQDSKILLIQWIFAQNFKNRLTRLNYESLAMFSLRVMAAYQKKEFNEIEAKKYSQQIAKDIQLDSFIPGEFLQERLTLFISHLINKQWKILEAPKNSYFLSNDKPIFSPNLHPFHRQHRPFHLNPELNAHSMIYFVLTPKFCLEITPFTRGTPIDANLLNMKVDYELATNVGVLCVNRGIIDTADRLIISNCPLHLEKLVSLSN